MGRSSEVDSNGSPAEGWLTRHMTLVKDRKPICRVKRPPFRCNASFILTVGGFEKTYNLPSGWDSCKLFPDAENHHQAKEWPAFLSHMQKYNLAAAVKVGKCELYVLPPIEGHKHATVLYRTNCPNHGSSNQHHEAGTFLNEPRGINRLEPENVKISDPRNYIKTNPSYLVTLGQAHSGWIFGAIAELIDNSRDAKATRLDISIDCLYSKKEGRKIPVLSVIDNGHGMEHSDVVRMLSIGHEEPEEEDADRIGRFGVGFKTGAMKLGKDAIVLTQTSHSRSVAFLSQSFNKNKQHIEIPIVSYSKQGHLMEIDLSKQSEEFAEFHLKAIKKFSPFNEYFIGEKLGLFGENGTGTQIFIWNLEKWGSNYALEWDERDTDLNCSRQSQKDIRIRSRRIRSRPGQISQKVPLDYSLQSYMQVIFLDSRMKIYIQGSLVKNLPLAKSLNNTVTVKECLMGKSVQLTLGRCQVEWDRMNCGMFLYWHGRLIEAYKRVGAMIHNADVGRGLVGVIDVTDIMSDGDGCVWVLNNKQGFQDSEVYANLEEWLGHKADEYWDDNYDSLKLSKENMNYEPDHEWVQCNKCRKWRVLNREFDSSTLPRDWFCYMPPFEARCETPEEQVGRGVVTVKSKRSGYDLQQSHISVDSKLFHETEKDVKLLNTASSNKPLTLKNSKPASDKENALAPHTALLDSQNIMDQMEMSSHCNATNKLDNEDVEISFITYDDIEDSTEAQSPPRQILKRLQRGPKRSCKRF